MVISLIRRLRQFSRRIYVRVTIYAVLNVVALGVATLLGPIIPASLGRLIGADAVDTILQVIATSMLAVVTFSLTIMSSAFARAAGQWTPRSHMLMREDTVTHSVLATFLGAYLYALIAIILRAADLFGEREMVVVFGMTMVVIASIVWSIIRWISHLEGLGSLQVTARRLEVRAARAVAQAVEQPAQGANRLTDPANTIPRDAVPVHAADAGYVQQIFEAELQDIAAAREARIYVARPAGAYVQRGDVLALVADTTPDEEMEEAVRAAIPVSDVRSFDHDPVFCVTVLSEIATRALSPGVNDPGTAIDILHRLSHVIGDAGPSKEPDTPEHDRVWIEPLMPEELFYASFDPIARCANEAVEVHLALQSSLADIVRIGHPAVAAAAGEAALRCLARANGALENAGDRERLAAAMSIREAAAS